MFVADDRGIARRDRGRDDRIAGNKLRNTGRQDLMAMLGSPGPRRDVCRETETSMIGSADLRDKTINCADFDMTAEASGTVGKNAAGRMGVRDDEQAIARPSRYIPRIGCTLVCLAASRWRFDHDERCGRAECRRDRCIAHEPRSERPSSPTAPRTALQNGRRRGLKVGHNPSPNILSISSWPPATVLNQDWLWLL